MRRLAFFLLALAVLGSGPALAAHGKVGLWTVSSTIDLTLTMPPQVQAQMKTAGMKMPPASTFTSPMCMSQEEVNSDRPPQVDQNASGCNTHVIDRAGTFMTSEIVCTGKMKGSGHMQVAYHSAEHYTGFYTFKGSVGGNPTVLRSTFKGDWVRADCGNVKAYALRRQ